jgi:cytochrome c biogenesis protein CcmG, thiol:disulfide interchange protein DsbE
MKAKHWIPLAIFGVLVIFLAVGLTRDPRTLPSPLVDKNAPAFDLPQLVAADQRFTPASMKGQVWVLNVWASWCVACREEHPVLMEFSRTQQVMLIGLDYKDQRPDALKFLARHGDPYKFSVTDTDGRVGIDWGVYGVPETFVIDKQGVIRYKHIGPVTQEALTKTILPLIDKLKQS